MHFKDRRYSARDELYVIEMRDSKIDKYIQDHKLSSIMNNTKWKEMISAITSNSDYAPSVNIKTFFYPESKGYNPVWWEEVERDGFEYIERVNINPISEEYLGRLVESQKTDHSEFIINALDGKNIPYKIYDGIISVSGYISLK
ncbi:MAG: hypothetical protein ACI837_000597 [Crocinitomicaceae bacterium]